METGTLKQRTFFVDSESPVSNGRSMGSSNFGSLRLSPQELAEVKALEEKYGKNYNTGNFSKRIHQNLDAVEKDRKKIVKGEPVTLSQSLFLHLKSFMVLMVVLYVTYHFYTKLPEPIPSNADPSLFSEGKARPIAEYLSEGIGKRLVGSKNNEELAVLYILDNLMEIDKQLSNERLRGVKNVPTLEIELQRATGAHVFEIMGAVLTNIYSNITNIIARVSFSEESKNNAVLLNSHFDTTIGTKGATDATVPIAVLMETLRALVNQPREDSSRYINSVIFLFNGAEESLQEGSHAFITTHPWAEKARTILNIDACGGGAKELVFQASSAEILYAYARSVPHPHGYSVANDVFDTGLIQSDTDYRVFRAYKKLVGLDMAYYRNSYVYHTAIDTMDVVEPGVLQHTGDNVLSVVKELATTEFYKDDAHVKDTRVQYYDILGMFMVSYPMSLAKFLHLSTIAIVLLVGLNNNFFLHSKTILSMSFAPIAISFFSVTLSFLASIISPMVLAFVVSVVFGKKLLWFNQPALAWATYGLASLSGMIYVQYKFYSRNRSQRKIKADSLEWISLLSVTLFYGLFLFIFTIFNRGSSCMFFLWFTSLSGAVIYNFFNRDVSKSGTRVNGYSYIAAFIIPGVTTIQAELAISDVFIPLTGRLGPIPSDIVVATIFGLLTGLLSMMVIPLSHRARNIRKSAQVFAFMTFAVVLLSIMFKSPYDALHPKRIYVQHTYVVHSHPERVLQNGLITSYEAKYGDESYMVVSTADANNVRPEMFDIDFKKEFGSDPVLFKEPHANWDALFPYSLVIADTGFTLPIPAEGIAAPDLSILEDSYDEATNERSLKLRFRFDGNEWCTLKFDADLISWSLTDRIPTKSNNGFYMMRHVGGHGSKEWSVSLKMRGPQKVQFFLSASHFVITPAVKKFISLAPDWTTVTGMQTVMTKIEL